MTHESGTFANTRRQDVVADPAAVNFATQSEYALTVLATDGTAQSEQTIVVHVSGPPTATGAARSSCFGPT